MKKKRHFLIICLVTGITLMVLSVGLLTYLYHYERDDFVLAGFGQGGFYLDDWKIEHIEIYRDKHFGYASEEMGEPDLEKEKVSLSDEDREIIRDIINERLEDGKSVEAYQRLWYRYDAVVVYDGKCLYKLDLKNQIIFKEEYVAYTISEKPENMEPLRGYFLLTEEENQILKDIIMK